MQTPEERKEAHKRYYETHKYKWKAYNRKYKERTKYAYLQTLTDEQLQNAIENARKRMVTAALLIDHAIAEQERRAADSEVLQ